MRLEEGYAMVRSGWMMWWVVDVGSRREEGGV